MHRLFTFEYHEFGLSRVVVYQFARVLRFSGTAKRVPFVVSFHTFAKITILQNPISRPPAYTVYRTY
jgi:hypothetical protein